MRPPASESSATARKLAFLILTAGAVCATMLSLRAQRLDAAHRATAALDRARALERTYDDVTLEIARLTTPDRVRALLDDSDTDMQPMLIADTPR